MLKDKMWYVAPSCATTGEGLFEGLVSHLPISSSICDWRLMQDIGMALEQHQIPPCTKEDLGNRPPARCPPPMIRILFHMIAMYITPNISAAEEASTIASKQRSWIPFLYLSHYRSCTYLDEDDNSTQN